MRGRLAVAGVVAGVVTAGLAAGTASAATIDVPCSTPALVGAVSSANATTEPDTLALAPGCTYSIATPAFTGSPPGNSAGLPLITQPLTIEGRGATISRPGGAPAFRLMYAIGGFSGLNGSLELRDVLLFGGRLTTANQHGAAVASLGVPVVVRRAVVGLNQAAGGRGGAFAIAGGSLHIEDSTVGSNGATAGGAIYAAGAQTTIQRSTFSLNAASSNSGTILQEGGSSTIANSTFAGNVTLNPANATGGVVVTGCTANVCGAAQPGTAVVRSSTFADNGVFSDPRPGIALTAFVLGTPAATIEVEDTIVTDTDSTVGQPGCLEFGGGDVIDLGGNLEWPVTSCGFATRADPKLAALANNGGPTQTMRLLPGSPALELGGASCPPVDQRGEPRPEGDACDAGAYEANPPETTADGPDGPTNDPVVTFGADESPVSFECRIDGGDWATCESPLTVPGGDGDHTVEVRATDADGYTDPSPASVVLTIDRTAPEVTVTPVDSPTNDPQPDVAFGADEDATFECRVDGGDWAACTSPFEPASPLADGEHTVEVRATDAAGNTGEPKATTFVVDATAPETTITSGPSGTITETRAQFAFTSSEAGSTFECRLDAGPWTSCTSPQSYTGLAEGQHTFAVRATDAVGNTDATPATRTFTVKPCTLVRIRLTLLGAPVLVCI